MQELLGALLAAALLAALQFPFRVYFYWGSWRKRIFWMGLAFYLVFAGIGAGILGWLIGLKLADPTPYAVANGIISGVGGAMLVRVEIRGEALSKASSDGSVKVDPGLTPGFSLINAVTHWTVGMMDFMVMRSVESWIKSLNEVELLHQANVLVQKIRQLDISKEAKDELGKQLSAVMTDLRAAMGTAEERDRRIPVEQFCTVYYAEHREAKPVDS